MKNKFMKVVIIFAALVFALGAAGCGSDNKKEAAKTEGAKDGDNSLDDDIYEYLKTELESDKNPALNTESIPNPDDEEYEAKLEEWQIKVTEYTEQVFEDAAAKFDTTREQVSTVYTERFAEDMEDLANEMLEALPGDNSEEPGEEE